MHPFVRHLILTVLVALLPLASAEPAKPAAAAAPAAAAPAAAVETAAPAKKLSSTEEAAKNEELQKKLKAQQDKMDVWWYVKMGGKTNWWIIVCAAFGLLVAVERFLRLHRGSFAPAALAEQAPRLYAAGDLDGLKKLCAGNGSALAKIITFAVENRNAGIDVINEGAAEIAGREVAKHHGMNQYIAVSAQIAPLLGLFGTVVGMIDSFTVVAVAGDIGDTSMVADGISVALITTMFGLIVAIPGLALHHFFKGRINALGLVLEEVASATLRKMFVK